MCDDIVMICPECGGYMLNMTDADFEGIECETCHLIRRPDGTFDRQIHMESED